MHDVARKCILPGRLVERRCVCAHRSGSFFLYAIRGEETFVGAGAEPQCVAASRDLGVVDASFGRLSALEL